MASKKTPICRYRYWYAKLLQLYPKRYRERFGEEMKQTFSDLCRERMESGQRLFVFVLWMFFETFAQIIRENIVLMLRQTKSIVRVLLVTGSILLVPLLAMQFTDEVNWNFSDFAAAATLLISAGLMYELVLRASGNVAYRAGGGLAVATALILVWLNLAVGLIGNENNPANLMYGGVLVIAATGALISRFEPQGMARAMLATAVAQALVPVIALIIWQPPLTLGVLGVFALNTIFVMLFIGSAWLFRRASRHRFDAALHDS
jgi:hypothetical protein